MKPFRLWWGMIHPRLLRVGKIIGRVQTAILLTVVYVVVVGLSWPFAWWSERRAQLQRGNGWAPKELDLSIEACTRQF